MRIIRFIIVAMVVSKALAPVTGWSQDLGPGEFIVNSQIVSDQVVAGDASVEGGSVVGGSACADGNCSGANGGGVGISGTGVGGGVGTGRVRGRLASAVGSIGDLARGGYAGDIDSGCVPRTYGYPDLFYNYYTQGNCNATNAQMYIAPVPVPPNVGHTFYTYQPFMPHEMLYWHKDSYHNYYDGGRGMNHTKVHYYGPPVKTAVSNIYWNVLRIPR
jgi:hypothetical protein